MLSLFIVLRSNILVWCFFRVISRNSLFDICTDINLFPKNDFVQQKTELVIYSAHKLMFKKI